MIAVKTLLMVLAFVCLLLAALGVQAPKFNLFALGMALWALNVLLP